MKRSFEVDDEQATVDEFDAMLNDSCEQIKLFGHSFDPSKVLKRCDPIAYRLAFNAWADNRE